MKIFVSLVSWEEKAYITRNCSTSKIEKYDNFYNLFLHSLFQEIYEKLFYQLLDIVDDETYDDGVEFFFDNFDELSFIIEHFEKGYEMPKIPINEVIEIINK